MGFALAAPPPLPLPADAADCPSSLLLLLGLPPPHVAAHKSLGTAGGTALSAVPAGARIASGIAAAASPARRLLLLLLFHRLLRAASVCSNPRTFVRTPSSADG